MRGIYSVTWHPVYFTPCLEIGNIHSFYFATIEGVISNADDSIRNIDGSEAAAVTEGVISNASDSIRNIDGREAATAIEGVISNVGDSIRNIDGREAAAAIEGVISNVRNCSWYNGIS